MKKIFILIIFIIQLFFLLNFMQCQGFNQAFFLRPYYVDLQLGGDIHGVKNQPLWEVRLFHNKLEAYAIAIYDSYLYFFYFPFLLYFLSSIGFWGFLCGFYFFVFRKKRNIDYLLLTLVLVVPLIEVFIIAKTPFIITLILLWLAFQSWSLYGSYQFLNQKNNTYVLYSVAAILILLSVLWYFFYNDGIGAYCHLTHPATHFPFF